MKSVAILGAILLAAGTAAYGQAVTGTISGNVIDPAGAVVVGATIRAINMDTAESHTTTTNEQGGYLFPALSAGRYRIEAEASGFKKVVHEGVTLGVNQNARVDLALQVGSLTQEVRVQGDAPLVDTREVQLGGTVDNERVVDLPLNGRSVYSLVSTCRGWHAPPRRSPAATMTIT